MRRDKVDERLKARNNQSRRWEDKSKQGNPDFKVREQWLGWR